jgi:two-component system chemotaxis response regulator CheB
MTAPARILVCEDSATYARGLTRFLEADGELQVVGVCATGEAALEAVPRLTPDLVTMDIDLPGMSGILAVKRIMRTHAVPILVLSGQVERGSERAAEALAAGALEALPKTAVRIDDPAGPTAVALRRKLSRLARATSADGRHAPSAPPGPVLNRNGPATVIGICASTGGPRALETVLAGLPPDFPLPVLVVQHMAPGFLEGLILWLDQHVPLPVALASHGQPAGPGIWFAPDDAHLTLDPSLRLALDGETVAGPHRPAGDVLLRSLAASAGAGAVGVVLTGMGRDGAAGVEAIHAAGGRVVAQDEKTSAVFGMPRAAAEAGAQVVLPLNRVADAIRNLAVTEART